MKLLLVFINNEYRPMIPPNLNMLEGYVKNRGVMRHFTTLFRENK